MNNATSNTLTISLSGGIRGIVELEVLRQMQKSLGVNISITEFFDLIVGTRYEILNFEGSHH
jgi:patatin-like phospholipase/acyl hydrolase